MFGWLLHLLAWIANLITSAFWLGLFFAGCFSVFFLLKSRKISDGYKYGFISAIGLLSYCMIYIKSQSRPVNRSVQLFSLNSYYSRKGNSHSQILEQFEFRSTYEDPNGAEIDISKMIDKKRYFTVWETPVAFEFTDIIIELLEKKGSKYLYVDLSILVGLEKKYQKDKVYYWGLFAQSLISHFQSPKQSHPLTVIFDKVVPLVSSQQSEADIKEWEYFADILATLYRKLDYVNVFVITESSPVMDALEATSLSRLATFKRVAGFHKEKLQSFVVNYINSNMEGKVSAEQATRYAVDVTQASTASLTDVVKLLKKPQLIKGIPFGFD
jgi:hypothetical protein